MIFQTLYQILLAPKASDEGVRRRERILNILLLGAIGLSCVAFALTLVQFLIIGDTSTVRSLSITFIAIFIFAFFLLLSRLGLRILATYLFVGTFMLLATYPAVKWGILLPQGILLFSLIIVMSGVLLGSRIAFWMAGISSAILVVLVHLDEAGSINFDTSWAFTGGNYKDAITFGVTFIIIALVSWLSNREIQDSLDRARRSEQELLHERNLLEIKVKERTKALEKAQVEKMLDLQRFAEFGRLSSTLLHEIANPLTSVSLNLEQLQGKNRSVLVSHAREGIAHMEEYVEAARRQLRNQSEIKTFDIADEIERIVGFVDAKARKQQVNITLQLAKGVSIRGDNIKFNHIISNLLNNAIDAYDGVRRADKKILISMKNEDQTVRIVVRDRGRGIKKNQLPHIFEPFYTTKDASRGTGIGLAITKQAVEESFQGMITASSDKQGTEFIIRLPLV